MRLPSAIRLISPSETARHGPVLIGLGLAIQIMAAWWPFAPVVTGMSLVALGATGATIAWLNRSGWPRLLLLPHLAIYAALYILFIGALWHAASQGPQHSWQLSQWLDVALSIWPMAAAFNLALLAATGRVRGEDATSR